MKKVIVTGAAGFIGRQTLQPLLERGYEVHAVDLADLSREFNEVHWHRLDLGDRAAVTALLAEIKADSLLHFAWFTRHGEYWNSAENFRSHENSTALLQAFIAGGGRRVVAAGTCAEYSWNNEICAETSSPTEPATVYGKCKLAFMKELENLAQEHDLSWAWGRLFFLFGPYENEKRFVASLIKALLAGKQAPCSHGRQIRDFLATTEAGSAFASLLASDVQGAVNIASGQPTSLKEIALLLENFCKAPGKVGFGAIAANANEPAAITAATARLNREVGWHPAQSLEARLQQTVEWWRKHA